MNYFFRLSFQFRLFFLIAFLAVLAACQSGRKPEETTVRDTPPPTAKADARPSAAVPAIAEHLSGWVAYQQGLNADFDAALLQPADTTTLEPLAVAFDFSDTFREMYGRHLLYAPDSLRLLDLYSYKLAMEKTANGRIRANIHPDSELALLVPASRQRQRLLFFGPSGAFDDAYWLDGNRAFVVGTADESGSGKFAPLGWLIDFSANTIVHYQYTASLPHSAEGYWKIRLKPVI